MLDVVGKVLRRIDGYTVTAVNPSLDICYLKELGYWVKCRCVEEVKEGR